MGKRDASTDQEKKLEARSAKFQEGKTAGQIEEAAYIENSFRTLVKEARERGEINIPDDEIGNISKVYTRGFLIGKDTIVEGMAGKKTVFWKTSAEKSLKGVGSFGGTRDENTPYPTESGIQREELDAIDAKYNPVLLKQLYEKAVSQARGRSMNI